MSTHDSGWQEGYTAAGMIETFKPRKNAHRDNQISGYRAHKRTVVYTFCEHAWIHILQQRCFRQGL